MSKIIYKEDTGIVVVINPILDCINPNTGAYYTLEEIALKVVPTGNKYKILDVSDVSTDRSFRNAWTVDDSDLTDGEGS